MQEVLIWSEEHGAWWKPGRWGYTTSMAKAGHYSEGVAEEIVRRANVCGFNEIAVPVPEALTALALRGQRASQT